MNKHIYSVRILKVFLNLVVFCNPFLAKQLNTIATFLYDTRKALPGLPEGLFVNN